MPYEISETAKRIIALLHNSRTLAITHQQRPLAADVARACRIAIEDSSFLEELGTVDQLILAIPGKMTQSLTDLFDAVEAEIAGADFRRKGSG